MKAYVGGLPGSYVCVRAVRCGCSLVPVITLGILRFQAL